MDPGSVAARKPLRMPDFRDYAVEITKPGRVRVENTFVLGQMLRDVLKLPAVDVGHGWLIFGLPPAELAVHPSGKNDVHEFYLMCDDVAALIAEMKTYGVACSDVQNQGWGLLTHVSLPGGGKLGIYQPRHARP